jgi:hypothetical protein
VLYRRESLSTATGLSRLAQQLPLIADCPNIDSAENRVLFQERVAQSFGPKKRDPHSTMIQIAIKAANGMITSMVTSPTLFP